MMMSRRIMPEIMQPQFPVSPSFGSGGRRSGGFIIFQYNAAKAIFEKSFDMVRYQR